MPQLQYAVEIQTVQRVKYSSGEKGLRFGVTRIQPPGQFHEWFEDYTSAETFRQKFASFHVADTRVATFRVQKNGSYVRTNEDIAALKAWSLPFEANLTEFSANLKPQTE